MRVPIYIYPKQLFLLHFEPYIYKYSQTHNLCPSIDFFFKIYFPLESQIKEFSCLI